MERNLRTTSYTFNFVWTPEYRHNSFATEIKEILFFGKIGFLTTRKEILFLGKIGFLATPQVQYNRGKKQMKKKANFAKWTGLWLLVAILIMPQAGVAESPPGIAVDVVIHEGRFVIFSLTNFYKNQAFQCPFIWVDAKVEDRHGDVVGHRKIMALDVALPAGSRKKQKEAGKEIIQELEMIFDQPRIMEVSRPFHNCQSIQTFNVNNNSLAAGEVFQDYLKDGSKGPSMVWIPAGTFRMGDIQGGGEDDEKPVHRVSVSRFAMGRYEVTFAEYDKFAQATGRKKPSDSGWGRGNRPVINVSWHDAMAYAEWLSQQTGKQYRLPTEAEWEYAARAGTETKYWWGNSIGSNKANCDGCGSRWDEKQTAPVGSFAANAFGIYDTVGNVWEWTCSLYENKYSGKEQQCLIKSPSESSIFVQRGGSWGNVASRVRSANRDDWQPSVRFGLVGFRLARLP
ncbi:MAG: formylglycine-generating enzyme family protein [Pseudomonadota bacterium]